MQSIWRVGAYGFGAAKGDVRAPLPSADHDVGSAHDVTQVLQGAASGAWRKPWTASTTLSLPPGGEETFLSTFGLMRCPPGRLCTAALAIAPPPAATVKRP